MKNIEQWIDVRIANTLRENQKNIENNIQQEINKAWYILWFQWTILFIASMKIWNNISLLIKIIIICFFFISSTISFLTIIWKQELRQVNVINKKIFNRKDIVKEMEILYKKSKKIFYKKITLNKINMILQMILLLTMLIILLFR